MRVCLCMFLDCVPEKGFNLSPPPVILYCMCSVLAHTHTQSPHVSPTHLTISQPTQHPALIFSHPQFFSFCKYFYLSVCLFLCCCRCWKYTRDVEETQRLMENVFCHMSVLVSLRMKPQPCSETSCKYIFVCTVDKQIFLGWLAVTLLHPGFEEDVKGLGALQQFWRNILPCALCCQLTQVLDAENQSGQYER